VETKANPRPGVLSDKAVRGWLSLVGLLSMLMVVPARPPDYLMSFWVLSYQRGYRARALPASVLQGVGVERVSHQVIAAISAAFLLAALVLLVEFGVRAYRHDPGWPSLLLGLLLVGSPVTLQIQALELGSFDHLVVVLTLAPLLILLDRAGWAHVTAVGAMATLGVLVHEGFLLISLPLLLAAVAARRDPLPWRRLAADVAIIVVGPLLALAWIQAGPMVSLDEVPERTEVVARVAEVDPEEPAISWPIVNHTRSFTDNVAYSARRVSERGHREHLVALVACLPSLIAAAAVGRHLLAGANRRLLLALWAGVVVAPLLMMVIGHDWGRWFAFSTFNGLMAVVWVSARRRAPAATWATHTPMVLMVIALILPSLARDGAFRVRLGQPIQLLRTILGL
jgi:hypothetical protein